MSFDSHSLERLKQLGRELPQPIQPPAAKADPKPERKHRIETEEDPQELFRQLMQVSPDGTVPDHLLERLKSLERDRPVITDPQLSSQLQQQSKSSKSKSSKKVDDDDALYTAFQQLLLEEED